VTNAQTPSFRPLYPELSPYSTDLISREVLSHGGAHQIYVEQCGNPKGIPVIFLHGGPGSACRPQHRRYFDPAVYRIILFDQRGCGRSRPLGELENNTLQYLMADMEIIRQHLAIQQWVIFGGSWGSTLGLCYAQQYPEQVLAMILRGIFLARQQDIDWVYAQEGAAQLFPDVWQRLMQHLDPIERAAPISAFMDALLTTDKQQQTTIAYALYDWQSMIGRLAPLEDELTLDEEQLIAHFQIQLHFALQQCFIEQHAILDNIDTIHHIPAWLIQGRYDLVCPVKQTLALHQAWPDSRLNLIHLAGHAGDEPAVIHALIAATSTVAHRLSHLVNDHTA
jgi:proline iminopeptidase